MKLVTLISLLLSAFAATGQSPLSLHPQNPHYFIFRGKPTILISSAEHYGMVLNAELDYNTYLGTLKRCGFNQTRVFSGSFCEGDEYDTDPGKQYKWEDMQSTLSPRPGQFLSPWKRSTVPGYAGGGNKFDLDQWDDSYFQRLKEFCRQADNHGVVVEIVLFTANYTTKNWRNSPLNSQSNINGMPEVPYNEFHLLKHKELIARQVEMVRKIVQEVNEFDNIYFEVCNEPYWMKGIPRVEPGITEQQFLPEIDEWQNVIISTIVQAEQKLPKRHLIAQNFANTYRKLTDVDPRVSILNFHYAFPPAAVTDNYHWNRPIVFDETADGCSAPNRRREAWAFMLAGGAGYSNLDWSFATDDMTGMGRNPSGKRQSGKEVRDQLQVLHTTLRSFDFINSKPIQTELSMNLPEGLSVYGLVTTGKNYLLYFVKGRKVTFNSWRSPISEGSYEITYLDPMTGAIIGTDTVLARPNVDLAAPFFSDDIVVRMTRK